jgi:hypothetical protein
METLRFTPKVIAAGIGAIFSATLAQPAVAAPNVVSNTNDAVRIWGLDNSGTPLQVTGVSVEPFQGNPFTVMYADDNQGTAVTTSAPAADVASVTVYDGGLGSTTSASTYVNLKSGSSNIKVAGDKTTFTGNMDFSGATVTGLNNSNINNGGLANTNNWVNSDVTLTNNGSGVDTVYGVPTEGSTSHSVVVNSTDDVIINTNAQGTAGAFVVRTNGVEVIKSVTNGTTNTTTVGDGAGHSITFDATGAAISGNTSIAGTLAVSGATAINNSFAVDSNGATAGGNTLVVNGSGITATGATNINTTGTAATFIGNSTAATTVNAAGGNAALALANNNASLGVTGGGSVVTNANSAVMRGTGT